MADDRLIREFFPGFIKIHILYHAAQEPVCGVDLAEELAHHGYRVSPGTLYPTLHALEREGYLQREELTVQGRRRKYHSATSADVKRDNTDRSCLCQTINIHRARVSGQAKTARGVPFAGRHFCATF